jgi:hypothetical protein
MEGTAIWSQLVLGIVDDEHVPLLVDRLIAFANWVTRHRKRGKRQERALC